jgi:hypothetical protein
MLLLPFFGDQHSNAQKIEAGMFYASFSKLSYVRDT